MVAEPRYVHTSRVASFHHARSFRHTHGFSVHRDLDGVGDGGRGEGPCEQQTSFSDGLHSSRERHLRPGRRDAAHARQEHDTSVFVFVFVFVGAAPGSTTTLANTMRIFGRGIRPTREGMVLVDVFRSVGGEGRCEEAAEAQWIGEKETGGRVPHGTRRCSRSSSTYNAVEGLDTCSSHHAASASKRSLGREETPRRGALVHPVTDPDDLPLDQGS